MKYNFAILCYKDHPWSKLIVNNLLTNNFIPSIIIEEDSKSGNKKINFYDKLLSDSRIKLDDYNNLSNLSQKNNIKHLIVDNHNSLDTFNFLAQEKLDLILLANTRIIKPHIYRQAKIGAFNCHPDKLPGYRGSVVFLRKILEDLPLGVTCHWVNEVVDTGSIAYYQDVNYQLGDTLGDLVYKIIETSSNHFITLLNNNNIPKTEQNIVDTPCFRFPEEDIIEKCRIKLDLKKNLTNNING